MNTKDFNKIVADTILSTAALLTKKGEEYAAKEDCLSNFKEGAQAFSLTPLQVALVFSRKHFSAICNYVRKDAQGLTQNLSEPIEGRIDDLINYCFFLKALVQESRDAIPRQRGEEEPKFPYVEHGLRNGEFCAREVPQTNFPQIKTEFLTDWTEQPPFSPRDEHLRVENERFKKYQAVMTSLQAELYND